MPCQGDRAVNYEVAIKIEERILVDPSLALSEEGVELLGNPDLVGQLVVSRAFFESLSDRTRRDELLAFADDYDGDLISRVRERLASDAIEKFDYREVLDSLEGLGEAAADQWVFLATRSWIVSKTEKFFGRLRRAAARVLDVAEETLRRVADGLGSAAFRIAEFAKEHAEGVRVIVGFANPAIAQFLRHLGIPINEADLDLMEESALEIITAYDC